MYKTIIVGLDCSDISEKVIKALNTLKIEPQTKIILVHVISSSETDQDMDLETPHQSEESIYQNLEHQLHSYKDKISGSEIEILRGDPAEEIIRTANIYQADLIIIGTRGLQGLKRIIEGSVSSQVVADATCSVLVVKS